MKRYTLPLLGALILVASLNANAAGYIKFDGVDGESTDTDHRGWSDIQSFSFGTTRPVGGTTGEGPGRVRPTDFLFQKPVDKASPKLMEACAVGHVIPVVIIDFTRPSVRGGGVSYLTYELKNVLVTSYSVGGAGAHATGDVVPMESLSLNFTEIKITYTEIDPVSGEAQGKPEYTWKVEEGEH